MIKKSFYLVAFALLAFLASCSSDDKEAFSRVVVDSETGLFEVVQGEGLVLKAFVESEKESALQWYVNGKEVAGETQSTFVFKQEERGLYTVKLEAKNALGVASNQVEIEVYGRYREGAFVLNEGQMGKVPGSLIYISPKGDVVIDHAYEKENGSKLGDSAQDLYIADGKIYILSQNGGNDGQLIVADAETLKKELAFSKEELGLSAPTNLVVTGDYAFIRDSKGVHKLNIKTRKLTSIKGTEGARKNRMAVADGKIFSAAQKNLLIMDKTSLEAREVFFDGTISGIINGPKGYLWVSLAGDVNAICLVNPKDGSIKEMNKIEGVKLGSGPAASPAITAKGDTLYFTNELSSWSLGKKIYRHIFSKEQTDIVVDVEKVVENAGIVYGTVGVNPANGDLIFNTVKGFGDNFKINNLSVFNYNKAGELVLKNNYKDMLWFPAGSYFTAYFK